MDIKTLVPPDDLIKIIPDVGTLRFTTDYSTFVQQAPIPHLKTEGIDDPELVGEINHIQKFINTDYAIIQTLAGNWYPALNDIYGFFLDMEHFANIRIGVYLDELYQFGQAKDKHRTLVALDRMRSFALKQYLQAKDALSDNVVYKGRLANAQIGIKQDYVQVKAALSNLTKYTTELEEKRAELQAKVAANNKKVTETAIQEVKDIVTNGVALATDAATENYADAIKTGALLSVNAIEAGVTIVKTDIETINLLKEITQIALKLSDVERDLQVLFNATAQMASLMDSVTFSNSSITAFEGYWDGLHTYSQKMIDDVNNGTFPDIEEPKAVAETWAKTIGGPLTTVLGPSVKQTIEWNAAKVEFQQL